MQRNVLWTLALALLAALALSVPAHAGEGEGKPKAQTFTGKVTQVGADSITVAKQREGQAAEERNIALNQATKVYLEGGAAQEQDQPVLEGGQKPNHREGTLADIKVGQHVTVKYADGVALSVHIHKTPAPKPGKEG